MDYKYSVSLWGSVFVDFHISARPASIRGIDAASVKLTPTYVYLQLRVFKYSYLGSAPRIALPIPTHGTSDPFVAFSYAFWRSLERP